MSNIRVVSGDAYLQDRRITLTATDIDGAAIDLTGTDLTFWVQRRRGDSTRLIEKTTLDGIEIASPQTGDTKGVCYLELDELDTEDLEGRYLWELEADDAIGKLTLGGGKFYVDPDLVTA